jgi:hypothetical protein
LSRPHSGQTRCAQQAGSPTSSCPVAGDEGDACPLLVHRRRHSPPLRVRSGQPAAGSRFDHRRFNGVFVPTTIRGEPQALSPPHTSVPARHGRWPAGPAWWPTGRQRRVFARRARRRSQIAWPALAVLLATGIWNIAAEQDKITGNHRTTLIAKLGRGTGAGCHGLLARPLAQHRRARGLRHPRRRQRADCPVSRHLAGG